MRLESLESRYMLAQAISPIAQDLRFSTVIATLAENQRNEPNVLIAADKSLLTQDLSSKLEGRGRRVVALEAGTDPLSTISEALAGMRNVCAVHILTHGKAGALTIGGTEIDSAALTRDAGALGQWSKSLTKGAFVALYGCDIADRAAGQAFVTALARRTGATVAASTDLTGAASKGGDWNLEYVARGAGDEGVAIDALKIADFDGVLALTISPSGGTTSHVVGVGSDAIVIDSGVSLSGTPATLTSAKVKINSGYRNGEDVLALPSPPAGFSASWSAANGELTITSGAAQTIAAYQNVLRTVTYTNTQSPFANLSTRGITFTADTTTSAAKSLTPVLPIDAAIQESLLDAFDAIDKIGQKISAIAGTPYKGDTTQVPLVGQTLTDLMYPNLPGLDSSGNPVADTAHYSEPQQVGDYLRLLDAATDYFNAAGTITDLSGLKTALEAELSSLVPGTSPLRQVDVGFTTPTSTDNREVAITVTIRTANGTTMPLILSELQRDLGLKLTAAPTVGAGGGADIKFQITIDLTGHEYGGSTPDDIAASNVTINFERLNALAGTIFNGLNTPAEIGAIRGAITNGSGMIAALFPVSLGGSNSRTLSSWTTYANGASTPSFGTMGGAAEMTLPLGASIGGVAATTANTKVVVTDGNLFDSTGFTYTTTDFEKLIYFSGVRVEDIIQQVLKVGDLYATLDNSGENLFGVRVPFVDNTRLGDVLKFKDLFDAAIASKVDIYEPLLNTPGRDELIDYRLPISDDSTPQPSMYSDLRGAFKFGIVINNAWPIHTVTVAADGTRVSLDDLVTDVNTALTAAGVQITAANQSNKMVLKASNVAVQKFAVVPVAPDSGRLSPTTPPSDLSTLTLNTSQYYTVTGSTTGSITGTNYYTIGSTLAKAAVHAGLLDNGETGVVKVTRVGATGPLWDSTRHGVSSSSAASSTDAYLIESAVNDLRRLGIVGYDTTLGVLESASGGAIRATLPLQADLPFAGEIVVRNGSTNYTVNVADNARATLTEALVDVQAALITAGISNANLAARLVDAAGNALSGTPAANTDYFLQLYMPSGSGWAEFSLASSGDATAYRVLPLGFLSGDVSAQPRPEALRTFADFSNSTLFPGLTITPVYNNVANTVTMQFAATGSASPNLPADFDLDLSPLGKIVLTDANLAFATIVSNEINFGLEFTIGPSTAVSISSGQSVPSNGRLSGTANFSLDMVLQDRFDVTVPSGWTSGNSNIQDLVGDINRALKQTTNAVGGTVDLTTDRMVARWMFNGTQLELINATPIGSAIAVTQTNGVLSSDLAIAFQHKSKHYVVKLAAASTTTNTSFADLVVDLNAALSTAVYDANGNSLADSTETDVESLSTDAFFTTVSNTSGAATSDVYLFATSPAGNNWPATITLSAARTNPAVTQLGFDDSTSEATSVVTVRAPGAAAKLRNHTNGNPIAGGGVGINLPTFAGSVAYGFNTLNFASTTLGSVTSRTEVSLSSGVDAAAQDIGNDAEANFDRTLTGYNGTGNARAGVTLTNITASSGAAIDSNATVQIAIADMADATVIVDTPIGVPIPLDGTNHGRLGVTTTVNVLENGTQYSVLVAKPDTMANNTFAELAAQFNAGLADCTRTVGGVTTENFDASALYTITQYESEASLQINAKTPTANPDYADVTFQPGLSAFGEVGMQGSFGIATVADAMQDVLPVLDKLQSQTDLMSQFKLPLINLPVNELIDIKGDLLTRIDSLREMTVSSPGQIAAAVAAALSVPAANVRVVFDGTNNAYRVDFQFETGAAVAKPLDITLSDFYRFAEGDAPLSLNGFHDRGSSSPLAVKIKAITTVSLGIDLSDPEEPRAFLYGHDGSEDRRLSDGSANGTSVELELEASADDITFTAAVGSFGIFVKGGSASLGGPATETAGGDVQYTFDDETKQLHFNRTSAPAVLALALGTTGGKYYLDSGDAADLANYEKSFEGAVEANLPLFTPTEFINPFASREVDVPIAGSGVETVSPNGNIFNLQIPYLGAYAADSLQLAELQSQIAGIYAAAGGTLDGTQQSQVDDLQDEIDAMRTAGDVEIFMPDVDEASEDAVDPTVLDILRDPALIVDGVDVALSAIGSSLKELDNLDIPLIGGALGSAVDDVFAWSQPWLSDLKHQLRGQGEGVFQAAKDEIFDFLGPAGLNLLLKDNGIRSVEGMIPADSADDVTLDFLDADGRKMTGEAGLGAQAIEFKVRLGSVLVDTGADISFDFDALAPAFQLAIDGGLTFKLGWDVTLGFGISLEDGFYIVTDSDPVANELELRFEAGLSGRQVDFKVATRAGSISGYSIQDAAGAWVYGPEDGNGNASILDVMAVDIGGNNVSSAPFPQDCMDDEEVTSYWVVAVNNGSGTAVPAYLDQLGRYRPQTSRDPNKMVQYNQTAPFSAFGSLFAFNLTAIDQIRTGLDPIGDAEYFYDPSHASTITSNGRKDPTYGVNRNNNMPTRVAGRIGVNLLDPSAESGDYVARPGPTATGFMLMDGKDAFGGQPVLGDDGNFIPVSMVGGEWYRMEADPENPTGPLVVGDEITADETENRITFQEISEAGLDIFELKLNAEAVLNLSLTLSIGDDANIPKLTATLNVDWRTDSMKPPANPFAQDEEQQRDLVPEVGVNNIRLDMGSFLTKFIKPIATKVDGALEPLDPLIDVIQTRLPIISDIAGRDILFTNLLYTFGGPKGQAVATLIEMAILVRQLSAVMAAVPDDVNVYLPIGNFWLAKVGAGPLGRPGLGTQIYYDNNEVTAPSVTQRNQSMIANSGAALDSVTNALGSMDSMDKNSSSQPGVAQADRGGFQVPIIQDPVTIFKLMMGKDVPLVTFSLPKLNFVFNADIPLIKIVVFEVGLRVGIEMHGQLAMGYDTRGLKLFKESHDAEDLLEGFYISDRANADGTGADVDEFTMRANLALYGGVDLYLARGGIEGGLNFTASINLNDPDNDGKLRVVEAVDLVQQTGNVLDLADLAFAGEVYARYYYWAGLKIWTPWETYTVTLYEGGETFARAQIFSFTRDGSDGPPIMAAKVTTTDTDGTEHPSSLMLHMGPNALKRVSNQDPLKVKDGAESMKVWNDSPGSGTVHVQYLNYSGSYTKTFTGITRVVAFGGDNNDVIDASGLQGIPVEFDGGAGNDTITLGSGSASVQSTIRGGAGNDTITVSGGGAVRLDGDEGNDSITAGTGTSDIDGGAGNDTIAGGGSGSTNRIHSRRQFGIDRLTLNPVALINLLSFIDSTLPATANLQGANSTIYAGDTNGTIFDAAAVTEIRGSTGPDTFNVTNPTTRLANSGRGLVLSGGPGNDAYNITADNVSGISNDGITIDDGIYPTAVAAPGDVEVDECGEIKKIKVATPGSGYVVAPEVQITDSTGHGARAVASLDANGAIAGIFMLAPGDDYTNPQVVFVERTSPRDRINFKSSATGTFALTQDGNAGDDYRVSYNNKSIKFVGYANPGTNRPADYDVDEIDAARFDLPNGTFALNSDLDITDLLTINAHGLTQNAAMTADTVRITTDVGFSANHAINATNNGDVLIRVTGTNQATARRGTATATVVDGVITGIAVTDGGAGYDFVPTVSIIDPRGSKARARANLTNGVVTSITILDGGEGYLSSPAPQIVIARPASIQLNTNLSSSTVDSEPGTGDGRGTVTLRAEQGAINQSGDVFFPTGAQINWQFGDYRYTGSKSLEDITGALYPTTLGGQGATATAVLDEDGRVVGLNVTNGGSGYSKDFLPVVQIEGAATATAIVAPSGAISGFRVTYPGEGYAIAPKVTILPNGFGKIVGADATATALNRNHIKSAGGSLEATALDGIGDPSKPLKTDVENMVAATYASAAGINVLEKDAVRIGLIDHINGLQTSNGDINLANFAGAISLGQPVQQTDAAGNLLWQDANKTIPIYKRDANGNIEYQGGKLQAGTATIKLTADDVDVNSFVGASGGRLIMQPVKTTAEIGLNGTRARVNATIANGSLTGFTDLWEGRGYTSEPLVTMQGPGERAFGVASILAGEVTGIKISYGGTRYSANFPPTITLVGGGVNGATPTNAATAVATYTDGVVTGVTITDGGSGYLTTPEVVIAAPGTTARARAIVQNQRVVGFDIINPGTNYASAPDVVIAQPYPFNLEGEEIAYFQDGFDDIIIGRTEGRHLFHSADASFADGVTLRSPNGGSVQMERINVDGPVVIVGSGHTTNMTSDAPSISATYVEIDDNVVIHEDVDATITATTGHVSIFGTGKGKIDGVAASLTEDLTITDVGDVVVTGAIGSSYPIHDLTINSTGGGSITLQQSVSIEGDLHIVKGGAITLGGNVTIGGNLIIDDGATVTFNGTLNVTGNVTMSKATTVSFAQNVNVAGNFHIGDINDASKVESVTFASTARLDVSGAVEIYTYDSQAYGNRLGQTLTPTAMTLRTEIGDITFQSSVIMAATDITILKARDVTFAQELTADDLNIADATGQTRFQRATTLASMIVVSTSLVQVQNRLDITTGDAAITTNQLDFDGGSGSVDYIGAGTSTLTIKPRTSSRNITLGSPPGTFTSLDVSDVDIAAIGSGFEDVVFGNASAGTGTVTIGSIGSQQGVGNSQLLNATTIHGGAINVVQNVDSAAGSGLLKMIARTGNVTVSGTINGTGIERNDLVQLQANAGAITLNSPVYSANELRLIAAGAITEGANAFVSVPNLSLSSGGAVTLDNASNNVAVVGMNSGNNAIVFRNDHSYTIGTVNAVAGVNSGGAETTLIDNGGTVTQSQPIIAGGLLLLGTAGVFTLTNTSNNIGSLAGNTGSANYRDVNGVTIGTVAGVNGLTVSGSAIVTAGIHFFIDQPVTAANGAITLTALTGAMISNNLGDVTAIGGAVTLTSADYMTLNGDVTSTTHGVTLDAGENLQVNAPISAYGNVSVTSDAALATSQIVSSHGGITLWAYGNFDANGPITANGAASFTSSTGAVDLKAAGDVSAASVSVSSATSMVVAGDVTSTTGNVNLTAAGLLTTTGAINSAADVTASAGTSTTFAGAISAVGKVTSTSVTTLTTTSAGDISGGGNVALSAASISAAGDVFSTGGTVSISAPGNVDVTGAVSSKTGTTVTSTNGAASVGALASTNGGVNITAENNIDAHAAITGSGAVEIDSNNGAVNITSTGSVSGASVALTADTSVVISGAVTSTLGGITVDAGTTINTSANITSAADATLHAAAAIVLDAKVNAAGAVTVTSDTSTIATTTNGEITAGGVASLSAPGNITANASIAGGTGVSVTSSTGAIALDGVGSSAGGMAVHAQNNVNLNDAVNVHGAASIISDAGSILSQAAGDVVAGSVAMTAASGINLAGDVTSTADDITLNAGTDVSTSGVISAGANFTETAGQSISATAAISAGVDIAMTATSGALVTTADADITSATGNVTLDAAHDVALAGDVTATAGDITATAGINISTTGTLSAGGTITETAAGAVAAQAAIIAGGDIAITGSAGPITTSAAADITSSDGDVTLDTPAGMYLDGDVTATAGNISMDAGSIIQTTGQLTAGQKITATSGNEIYASAAITAGGDIAMDADGGALTTTAAAGITSSTGNVALESSAGMNLAGDVKSNQGSINLGAGGALETSGEISAGTTLTANATEVSASDSIHAGTGIAITATSGPITTTADADITSDSGDVLLESTAAMTLAGDVTATDGSISATAIDAVETSGTLNASDQITVSGSSIAASAAITAGNNVALTSTNGAITTTADGDITSSDAAVTLHSSADVNLAGEVSAGTTLTVNAGTLIEASAAISAGDDITMSAADGWINTTTAADITSDTGDVTLSSTAGLGLNGDVVATEGNISATTTDGGVQTNGVVTAGGTITETGDAIGATGAITAGGDITLTAQDGTVETQQDVDITSSSGNVAISSSFESTLLGDVAATDGNITITAGDFIQTEGTLTAGATITETATSFIAATNTIHAGGDVAVTAQGAYISIGGDADITSDTGNVTLDASTSMNVAGDITATDGNVTLSASDNVETTGVVTAGGNIDVSSSSGALAAGQMNSTGTVDLTAHENIDANAPITGGMAVSIFTQDGSVYITSAAPVSGSEVAIEAEHGIVTAANVTSTTGDVTLVAGDNIEVGAAISAAASMTATAGGSITTTAAGDISSTQGNITLTAGTSLTLATDATATDGDVVLSADTNLETTGTINAKSDVTVTSANGAIAAGPMTAQTGNVSVTADGNVDVNAAISAGTLAAIASQSGAVNVKADSGVTGGAVTITADSTVLVADDVTSTTGDVTIDAGFSLGITAPITSAGKITTTSASGTYSHAAITAVGAISMTAAAITTDANGDISGAGVTLNSGADVTTAGDIVSTTGAITVDSGEDFDATGAINSAGALTATADGSMSFAAAIDADGNISLNAQGTSLGTSAAADMTSGGSITLHSNTTTQLLGDITAASNVTATASSNITFGAPVNAGGAVSATSTNGKVTANAAVNAAGNISFDAGTQVITAAAGDLKSTNGSVTLTSDGTMTLAGDVKSDNSTVTIDAGDNLTATGIINAKGNAVIESDGSTTALAMVTSSNGAVSVVGDGNLTLSGAITSKANTNLNAIHGSLSVSAPITSDGLVLLVAPNGNITTSPAGDIHAVGNAAMQAGGSIATGGDIISSAGGVGLDADTSLDTTGIIQSAGMTHLIGATISTAGSITSSDAVEIDATVSVMINAPINAGTTVDVAAGTDITTTPAGDITAGASITLDADDDLNVEGDLNAPTITLHSTGDAAIAAIDATGNVTVTAGGNLSATGTIVTPGPVTLNATGQLNLNGNADIAAGGNVDLTGGAGIHTAADVYTSGDLIKFNSPVTLTGDVALNTARGARGAVTFVSSVNGAYGLTAWVAKDLKFLGPIGNTERVATLLIRNARAATFVADANVGWLRQSTATGQTLVMGTVSTTRANGFDLHAPGINVLGTVITKNGGPLMLDAMGSEISLGAASLLSSSGGVKMDASSVKQTDGSKVYATGGSDIVLTADNLALATTPNAWNGGGRFVLQPISASRRIDVGRAGTAFEINSNELNGIAGGFVTVVIGRGHTTFDSGDTGEHVIVVGDAKFRSSVLFRSEGSAGDISVLSSLTTVGNGTNINLVSGGNITVNGSIGAQSTGSILLAADVDNDHVGTVNIANSANAVLGAASGNITLQGVHLKLGTAATTATIAAPLGTTTLRTTDQSSTVIINNNKSNLSGNALYIGAAGSYHPSSVSIQGNLFASTDLDVYSSGQMNVNSFRIRAKNKTNLRAAGDLSLTDGMVIAQDGGVTLIADGDTNGSGTRKLTNVDISEPSSLDLQTTVETVNLPASFKPGQQGQATIRVTNLGTKAIDKYVSLLVYTSNNGRLKAGDRVIGRLTPRVRLAAGGSGLYTVDLQIPQLHGTGSFKLVAELLPYAVSYSTGGAKDANVSVSAATFTVT